MTQAVPVSRAMVPGSDRRLIEDSLPLDALNAISAKGKKHPKHPVAFSEDGFAPGRTSRIE